MYSWSKADIGQSRANVATLMDIFIQRNTLQSPINDLLRELSGTINLLQTKCVPSKLRSIKDLLRLL